MQVRKHGQILPACPTITSSSHIDKKSTKRQRVSARRRKKSAEKQCFLLPIVRREAGNDVSCIKSADGKQETMFLASNLRTGRRNRVFLAPNRRTGNKKQRFLHQIAGREGEIVCFTLHVVSRLAKNAEILPFPHCCPIPAAFQRHRLSVVSPASGRSIATKCAK